MTLRKLVFAVSLVVATPVFAEDAGFLKMFELKSHEKLADVRAQSTLAPFTTDGCSGGMSATWSVVAHLFPTFEDIHMETPPWQDCCVTHDRAYHLGNEDPTPNASYAARLVADQTLQACVAETAESRRDVLKSEYGMSDSQIDMAFRMIGATMYDAVRFGGGPCSGLPWRWGYGWPSCLID